MKYLIGIYEQQTTLIWETTNNIVEVAARKKIAIWMFESEEMFIIIMLKVGNFDRVII